MKAHRTADSILILPETPEDHEFLVELTKENGKWGATTHNSAEGVIQFICIGPLTKKSINDAEKKGAPVWKSKA